MKIKYNEKCWNKIDDYHFRTKDGNREEKMFKLGDSWIVTGGMEKPERVTFAPSFYPRKKDAIHLLELNVARCPRSYRNKHGQVVTEYYD